MPLRPVQRFNHVAVTVPLDAGGRAGLLRLYREVFGRTEMPTLSQDLGRRVLRAWRFSGYPLEVSPSA